VGYGLKLAREWRGWGFDVRERAFAQRHKEAISPVRTHRKIRRVVLAREQEVALPCRREAGWCKTLADDSQQKMPAMHEVPCLVRPLTVSGFVAAVQRSQGNPVLRPVLLGAEDELHECEGE